MFTTMSVADADFTDGRWQTYHKLMVDLRERFDSTFPDTPWEDFKKRMLSYQQPEKGYDRFVIFDDNNPVGWIQMMIFNARTPQQNGSLGFDTLYEDVPEDVSHLMAKRIYDYLVKFECPSANTMTETERMMRLPQMWKSAYLNRLERFRLYRDSANHIIIEKWLTEIPAQNQDLKLIIYSAIPEKYLNQYAELFARYINEMPKENENAKKYHVAPEEIRRQEKWREDNNSRLITSLLLHNVNGVIGISNIMINMSDPREAYQAMTGVTAKYRGRGLSKWLKASLYEKIGKDFHGNEFMVTDMRAANKPIYVVNEQMGYKLFSKGAEFEIYSTQLKKYLDGIEK
ncbi:MAG: hypothetical protein V3V99_01980 [candidate division Zixibacteria bacterium]